MSWDAYIKDSLLGTGCVSQAAICGHDGSVWAASEGFSLTPKEVKDLVTGFTDPSGLRASGLRACGKKYFTLGTDEISLKGKQGSCGICVVKTGQALVVGVYNDNIQPGQCTNVVMKLGDYLRNAGY